MSSSRAFRKPKNLENERNEVNRKQFPKVNKCSEKVVFEKMFLEWPNGIGTQKSSTRALRIQNCLVLAANITAESLNFWLIKLVKEQSLIALDLLCQFLC